MSAELEEQRNESKGLGVERNSRCYGIRIETRIYELWPRASVISAAVCATRDFFLQKETRQTKVRLMNLAGVDERNPGVLVAFASFCNETAS